MREAAAAAAAASASRFRGGWGMGGGVEAGCSLLGPPSPQLPGPNISLRQASLCRATKQLMPTPRGRRPPPTPWGRVWSIVLCVSRGDDLALLGLWGGEAEETGHRERGEGEGEERRRLGTEEKRRG